MAKSEKEKMDELVEREVRFWKRKRELIGEEKWRELVKAVENRLTNHLLQTPEPFVLSNEVVGGDQFFGVEFGPRVPGEPRRMESRYVIDQIVNRAGVLSAMVVTLRCWEDWSCKTAIEYNKSMVARILSEHKKSFSTRSQTEVQTRTVIMWMRLRGKFFWNKNNKVNLANLYFDESSKMRHQFPGTFSPDLTSASAV